MSPQPTYAFLPNPPFRRLKRSGVPIPGPEGQITPDKTVPAGYRIVQAELASWIREGVSLCINAAGPVFVLVTGLGNPYPLGLDKVSGDGSVTTETVTVRRVYFERTEK